MARLSTGCFDTFQPSSQCVAVIRPVCLAARRRSPLAKQTVGICRDILLLLREFLNTTLLLFGSKYGTDNLTKECRIVGQSLLQQLRGYVVVSVEKGQERPFDLEQVIGIRIRVLLQPLYDLDNGMHIYGMSAF